MGTPILKPPIEYGADCNFCTPARWPVGETPKYIYCMFWGIEDCGVSPHPAPNGSVFRMEQGLGTPCQWFHQGDTWWPDFTPRQIGQVTSRLRLNDHHGFSFFTQTGIACPNEYAQYSNATLVCAGMIAGAKGFGTIFWNEDVTTLVNQFGLEPGTKLFYELFKSTPFYFVHKFCDTHQRTNIKFKRSVFF